MGGPKVEWRRGRKKRKRSPAKDAAAGGGTMARLMHQLVQVCLNAPLFILPLMAQDLPKTRTFKTLSLLHCVELCNVIFGSVEF